MKVLLPSNFPKFYRTLAGLRFPIKVADVLDMRAVLNEAIDKFEAPADTPSYREFVEALESAIHSFGVESRRHADRLTRLLTLLRDIHYNHSIASRDQEVELRTKLDEVREAKARSSRYGVVFVLVAIALAIAWIALPQASWLIKVATLVSTYLSYDFFHSLPTLEQENKALNQELNDLLRERITNVNWKMLIHKLALLMGYKKVSGVEVFNMDEDADRNDSLSFLN